MSLKNSLRVLAVGLVIAGGLLLIPSHIGTTDNACADPGGCGHTCPHTACVTVGCGDDGTVATNACTYASFQGPHDINCTIGCRNLKCN